mgnify:CR=1 FL=1
MLIKKREVYNFWSLGSLSLSLVTIYREIGLKIELNEEEYRIFIIFFCRVNNYNWLIIYRLHNCIVSASSSIFYSKELKKKSRIELFVRVFILINQQMCSLYFFLLRIKIVVEFWEREHFFFYCCCYVTRFQKLDKNIMYRKMFSLFFY